MLGFAVGFAPNPCSDEEEEEDRGGSDAIWAKGKCWFTSQVVGEAGHPPAGLSHWDLSKGLDPILIMIQLDILRSRSWAK